MIAAAAGHSGGNVVNQHSTLLGLLDSCSTKSMGRRLLERWIRQPLVSLKRIRERQAIVHWLSSEDRITLEDLRSAHLRGALSLFSVHRIVIVIVIVYECTRF